eukprot:TRINITY_DN5891_c0_g1_i1.p1 TRINITY_DN5891_c0_g1~~TRINITY_DN5891_c0_g1_i1.p1  ORF type:complete len:308 (+),score=46.85 TRINITY_DN5891_c0_g1_i1:39-926(+)
MLSSILNLPRGDEKRRASARRGLSVSSSSSCSSSNIEAPRSPSVPEVEALRESSIRRDCRPLLPVDWDDSVPVTPCCSDAGDGIVAARCGFGTFEHCAGFQVFSDDEERPQNPKQQYWNRLYGHAKVRAARLKTNQEEKAAKQLAEEHRITHEFMNPNQALSQRKLDMMCRHLNSTKSRERNLKTLKDRWDRVELKECTFTPAVHVAPHERGTRSGSSCRPPAKQIRSLTSRLHKDSQSRADLLRQEELKRARRERRKIEEEKRKANPAYAARVHEKAERRKKTRCLSELERREI